MSSIKPVQTYESSEHITRTVAPARTPPPPPSRSPIHARPAGTPPSAGAGGGATPPSLLEEALSYAKRGWHVLPVHGVADGRCTCGDPACGSPGKHPRIVGWPTEASTDAEVIRGWFGRWPDSNVGIATGRGSGFWAVDVDAPREGRPADGRATLASLESRHGRLPACPRVRTGGGGEHLLFRLPCDREVPNRTGPLPGLDVRGEGGFVVAPPSVHSSGRRYEWEVRPQEPGPAGPGDGVRSAAVPDAPAWLLDELLPPVAPGGSLPAAVAGSMGACRYGGHPRVLDELERVARRVAAAHVGGRHDALRNAAYLFGGYAAAGCVPLDLAREVLVVAGDTAKPEAPEEVRRTVDDGLRAGAARPVEPPSSPDDWSPPPDLDDPGPDDPGDLGEEPEWAPPAEPGDAPPPHPDDPGPWDQGDLGEAGRPSGEARLGRGGALDFDRMRALGWMSPGEGWITDPLPPRPCLLFDRARPGSEEPVGPGMLPRGETAILAGGGGVGKSYALIGLALAVITRRPWLGWFPVGEVDGRVALIAGEEDGDEVRRRIHAQARTMGLTGADERELSRRFLFRAAFGRSDLALTRPEDSSGCEASPALALRAILREEADRSGLPWSLLILDPLTRFAGRDVEVDNSAATRFAQVIEGFAALPGNPTVLVSHHLSKAARRADDESGAAGVRGSSGITDAFRWTARLDEVSSPTTSLEHVRFRVVEVNHARKPPSCSPGGLLITREEDGSLRAATEEERERFGWTSSQAASGRAGGDRKPTRPPRDLD